MPTATAALPSITAIRGSSLSLGHARRLLVQELAVERHGYLIGRALERAHLDDTLLPTPPDRSRRRSTKGHPRLWVIRCSGPANQRPAGRTAPIHSLNRVHSGTGPQRRSLSRARSPAEMRHRWSPPPRPPYVATRSGQAATAVIQAGISPPRRSCFDRPPIAWKRPSE